MVGAEVADGAVVLVGGEVGEAGGEDKVVGGGGGEGVVLGEGGELMGEEVGIMVVELLQQAQLDPGKQRTIHVAVAEEDWKVQPPLLIPSHLLASVTQQESAPAPPLALSTPKIANTQCIM